MSQSRPPINLGEIIAQREYYLEPGQKVVIRLGMPFPQAEYPHDSCCPYQIEGLGSGKVRVAHGIDAFQSIWLAMQMIGAELYTSDEFAAGKLKLAEGPPDPDLCLPVPRAMEDLLPPWPPPRPADHDASVAS